MPETGAYRWCVSMHTRFISTCYILVPLQVSNFAGATQVVGLEYRHIRDFHVLMSAGAKACVAHYTQFMDTVTRWCHSCNAHLEDIAVQIAIKDVTVRRGILLLVPDNTVVLGGQVAAVYRSTGFFPL